MSLATKIEGFQSILQFDNRWQLIAQRILFSRTRLHVYRRGSVEILIDHASGDACGLRDCFTSQMYRQFLPAMSLRSPLRVLDLGSHIGAFPLMLKDCGYEVGELLGVELNPVTYSRMKFNIERNLGQAHCTLINAGIAGESGEITLPLGSGSTSDSIYKRTGAAGAVTRKIRLITVDQALEEAGFGDKMIDLCKLDIEGAEYDVLSKPGHSGLGRCRFLLTEIHRVEGRDPNEAKQALASLGFVEVPAPGEPCPDVFCYRNERAADSA